MKKNNKPSKLRLHKETVRTLDGAVLGKVAGGFPTGPGLTCGGWSCTWCSNPCSFTILGQ